MYRLKPFYTPDEIENPSELFIEMVHGLLSDTLSEDTYIKWRTEVIKNRDDNDELERLGWNGIHSPIVEDGIKMSNIVYESKYMCTDRYVLVEDVKDIIGSATHAPVFVAVTGNNTLMAKGIKTITNSKYSHVSISFHESLDRLYSFGTDISGKFGFAVENFKKTFQNPKYDSELKVFCVLVPNEQVNKMRLKIDTMIANQKRLSYSYIGIIGYLTKVNVNIPDQMFCSQFVDTMFKSVGIDLTKKPSGFVSPSDLAKVRSNKTSIFKLYQGKVSKYNPDEVCRKLLNRQ